jgi:hypothetical protein
MQGLLGGLFWLFPFFVLSTPFFFLLQPGRFSLFRLGCLLFAFCTPSCFFRLFRCCRHFFLGFWFGSSGVPAQLETQRDAVQMFSARGCVHAVSLR